MDNRYYLEYEIDGGERVVLAFENVNDRDGCHISLDMYKAQLGPVTEAVMTRILAKFHGWWLRPDDKEHP